MRIGRVVRLLTDNKRKELLSGEDEKRRIMISIFYPSDDELDKDIETYYMDLFSPGQEEFIKRFIEYKSSENEHAFESYLRNLKINTYDNLPISKRDKQYPVIVFSPGLGMDRDSVIYNIENLVREGYIVFTIGHLYDADFVVLPDGKVVEQAEYIEHSTIEEKEQLVEIRKEDIIFLIDELSTLNNEDECIKGRLDINKIALFGHSIGGAAVFKAASEDIRIKAVVMLDGSLQIFHLKKDILEGKKMYIPFLNFRRGSIEYAEEMKKCIESNEDKLSGEEFKERIIMRHKSLIGQIQGQNELYDYLAGYKSFIKLKDSEHLTFTDWPVIFNHEFVNNVLPIKKAHEVISEITARFFNEFIGGVEGDYRSFIDNGCMQICKINKDGETLK